VSGLGCCVGRRFSLEPLVSHTSRISQTFPRFFSSSSTNGEIFNSKLIENWELIRGIDKDYLFNNLQEPLIITKGFKWLLVSIHDLGIFEWWTVIPLTAVLVRFALLPLNIMQTRIWIKRRKVERYLTELEKKWAASGVTEFRKQYEIHLIRKRRFKEYRLSMRRYIVSPLVQVSIFICFARAIRRIWAMDTSLTVEGALWFQNLMAPDAYTILPFLSTACLFISIHYKPFESLWSDLINKIDKNPIKPYEGFELETKQGKVRIPVTIMDWFALWGMFCFIFYADRAPAALYLYFMPSVGWRVFYVMAIRHSKTLQDRLGFDLKPLITNEEQQKDLPTKKMLQEKKSYTT